MKNSISRQYIYLISISLLLLVFVLVFAFGVLIPEGKKYRLRHSELIKVSKKLHEYEDLEYDTTEKLKDLQQKNRTIITAFSMLFNPTRFEEQNKKWFSNLTVSKVNLSKKEGYFAIYEVNTSSEINSPKSFYNFLDAVNKSDWIIGVSFPIDFKRKGDLIHASFRMKVYCNNRDTNVSTSVSEAK